MNRAFLTGLAAVLVIAVPPTAGAQEVAAPSEEDELQTDRDSFTPATTAVGRRRMVLETSYSFIDNRHVPDAHSFPELLVRRGISDRLELRLGWNYEAGGPTGAVSGIEFGDEDFIVERSSEMLYGLKLETTRQRRLLPTSAVILQGYTPTFGPSTASHFTVGEVFGWTLPNGWQWNSSLRFGTNTVGGDNFAQWAPSTVLKIPAGERWNFHVEYFGIMSDGKRPAQSQHYGSAGGHVLLTKDLELGIRVGVGLNEQTPRFFSNVGLGLRF
jgi:hypothetical protein